MLARDPNLGVTDIISMNAATRRIITNQIEIIIMKTKTNVKAGGLISSPFG